MKWSWCIVTVAACICYASKASSASGELVFAVEWPKQRLIYERGEVAVSESDPTERRYTAAVSEVPLKKIDVALDRAGVDIRIPQSSHDSLVTLDLSSATHWELMLSLAKASGLRISGIGLAESDGCVRLFVPAGPYLVAMATDDARQVYIELYECIDQTPTIAAQLDVTGVREDGTTQALPMAAVPDDHCTRFLVDTALDDLVGLRVALKGYPFVRKLHVTGPPGSDIDIDTLRLAFRFQSAQEMADEVAKRQYTCSVARYWQPGLEGLRRASGKVRYAGGVEPGAVRVKGDDGDFVPDVRGGGSGNWDTNSGYLAASSDLGPLNPPSWKTVEVTVNVVGEQTWNVQFPRSGGRKQ